MEVAAIALNCVAKIVQVHCLGSHVSSSALGRRYRDLSYLPNMLKT